MGWDYTLVHVKLTIPLAVALTGAFWPLATRLDVYRLIILITIAVVSTIPWDSYLIRTSIWDYPPGAVLGLTVFSIPIEEIFFFVIQTYITSLLYLLLSRPAVYGAYLCREQETDTVSTSHGQFHRRIGQLLLCATFLTGTFQIYAVETQRYLGLILIWATPFILLLWTVSADVILALPRSATLWPVVLPTFYLWIVDTLALHRGTWSIKSGTKTGIFLWPHLEIEEAIFFLVTNVLVVFGQIAIDTTLAILDNLQMHESNRDLPSLGSIFQALTASSERYDRRRIVGLSEGVQRLKAKSRSFYLASAVFQGSLRYDLILLYSFCRAADDLVDEAKDRDEAQLWVERLTTFLDLAYGSGATPDVVQTWVVENVPSQTCSAFLCLPVDRLEKQPLVDLVKGFQMDLDFGIEPPRAKLDGDSKLERRWPIQDEKDLELYGSLVAGTVAQLVMDLIIYHCGKGTQKLSTDRQKQLIKSACDMGIALQIVNVVRDVKVDAAIDRVYLPTSLLRTENITPSQVLEDPNSDQIRLVRMHALQRAFEIYEESKGALDLIPGPARPGLKVAVESYMEIGRVMWSQACSDKVRKQGRASVPLARRLIVAWSQLK